MDRKKEVIAAVQEVLNQPGMLLNDSGVIAAEIVDVLEAQGVQFESDRED